LEFEKESCCIKVEVLKENGERTQIIPRKLFQALNESSERKIGLFVHHLLSKFAD